MEQGAADVRPRASIRSFVGREVVALRDDGRWALESEGTPLGWLTEPSRHTPGECVTYDGRWEVELDRAHRLLMRAGASLVATYKSGFWPGGPIVLTDGPRLTLRPPIWGDGWKLRHRASLVLRIKERNVVRFGSAAAELYELPLVTVLALEARLLESRLPGGGGVGGADPITF